MNSVLLFLLSESNLSTSYTQTITQEKVSAIKVFFFFFKLEVSLEGLLSLAVHSFCNVVMFWACVLSVLFLLSPNQPMAHWSVTIDLFVVKTFHWLVSSIFNYIFFPVSISVNMVAK